MNDDQHKMLALKAKLRQLQDDITETKDSINLLIIKMFVESEPFKIGDRVARGDDVYELTAARVQWSMPYWFGRKVLKSGSLHKCESQLCGTLHPFESVVQS